MDKTYKILQSPMTSYSVLLFLADQREPVSGKEVARAMNIPYGTAMCHLETLVHVRFARRVGGAYELGQEAALIWARKKSQLEAKVDRCKRELNELEV